MTANETLLTSNPNLLPHTFLWAIYFSFIYFIANSLPRYLYPQWYQTLSKKKKTELPTYPLALSHHLIIVPLSMYFIYLDYLLPSQEEDPNYLPFNYFKAYSPILSYSFGYFVADLILYTLPEVLSGRPAYFIHHLFAIGLLFSVSQASGPCVRALPHLLLTELSSIFFSIAWILRQVGFRGSLIVTLFEHLFVLFYFLLRIIHLPLMLYGLVDHVHSLGPFQYCLIGVMVLQVYWFYLIIQTLRVRDLGGGKGEAGKENGDERKTKIESNGNKAKEQ